MDFLSWFLAVALSYGFDEDQVMEIHSNYCQNLYFQPQAEEKMLRYDCDIVKVWKEISRVKSGKY